MVLVKSDGPHACGNAAALSSKVGMGSIHSSCF